MSELKNMSANSDFQGRAGKLGLAIQGKLQVSRYTEEALEDYIGAVAYLRDQESDLYDDFDNDDAIVRMFLHSSTIELPKCTCATELPYYYWLVVHMMHTLLWTHDAVIDCKIGRNYMPLYTLFWPRKINIGDSCAYS